MKIVVNGQALRGDLIRSAVLRSDAVPVPVSLEAEIRVDESLIPHLQEGKIITAGLAEDPFWIIKVVRANARQSQGQHGAESVAVTAILDPCHAVAFVQQKAIIKERATLQQIYKACGASIKAIDADFPVDKFSCFTGETPSFHIARTLQENGGIVRWKAGKMQYIRLPDIFRQKPIMTLSDNASQNVASGFIERHQIQSFYSIDDKGQFVYGNREKARWARYIPGKTEQQLNSMTRCLVLRKIAKIGYSETIAAGDVVAIAGGDPLAVGTAAHVHRTGTDGAGAEQYTKLWLYSLEE